jgi:hypothetical protein
LPPVEAPVAMAAPKPEPEPEPAPSPVATPSTPVSTPDPDRSPAPVASTVAMASPVPDPEPVTTTERPVTATPSSHVAETSGRKGRRRARKVQRIVRHVDPWSVLKVSLLFYLSLFLVVLAAGVLMWGAGRSAGTVKSVESFITSLGFGNCEVDPNAKSSTVITPSTPTSDGDCGPGQVLVGGFKFEGSRVFEGFALGGLVLVVAGTAANTVLALLFNVISDVTGGVRFTVLEEEPIRRSSGSPR